MIWNLSPQSSFESRQNPKWKWQWLHKRYYQTHSIVSITIETHFPRLFFSTQNLVHFFMYFLVENWPKVVEVLHPPHFHFFKEGWFDSKAIKYKCIWRRDKPQWDNQAWQSWLYRHLSINMFWFVFLNPIWILHIFILSTHMTNYNQKFFCPKIKDFMWFDTCHWRNLLDGCYIIILRWPTL